MNMHENSIIKDPNGWKAQIENLSVPKRCKTDFYRKFHRKNMFRIGTGTKILEI